jgi:hypothetical protein
MNSLGRTRRSAYFAPSFFFRSWFLGLIVAVTGALEARCATRPVSYFSVDPAVRETVVGRPLAVEILARDALGAPVSEYTGAVRVSANVRASSPKVLFGEWTFGTEPVLELVNVSADAVDLSNWRVYSYFQGYSPPVLPWGGFIIPAPAVCPPGGVVILRSREPAPGRFPEFNGGIFAPLPPLGGRAALVLIDPDGQVADALPTGPGGLLPTITEPARIPESVWSGDPVYVHNFDRTLSLQRVGHRNHGSALDWIAAPPSLGVRNVGLELPLLTPEEALPMAPEVVELANGRWAGELMITRTASNVVLRADDGVGHTGASASVLVHPLPSLTLVLPVRLSESNAGSTQALFLFMNRLGPTW